MCSGKQVVLPLTLLILLLACSFAPTSPTPSDQAEEIRRHLEVLKNPNSSYKEWEAAINSLIRFGQPAVPALIQALYDKDLRYAAASALGKIGPAAQEALPALIQALSDKDSVVRSYAAAALEKMGPAAVPALGQALSDKDPQVRSDAADILGRIGPEAQKAVPYLIQALGDEDPKVRSEAADALGRIGPEAQKAVPYLIQTLGDEDLKVRSEAASALGEIGPDAKEAVPYLIQSLGDKDPEVRSKAASALGEIGPDAKEAVVALSQALSDKDREVRSVAAYALGKMGPAAVPALSQALSDKDSEVRSVAAYALKEIGPAAKEAVPSLMQSLQDKDTRVRSQAAAALRKISPSAQEAVPALIHTLKDEEKNVRITAADELGEIGTEASVAVPAIVAAFKEAEKDDRFIAASALLKIVKPVRNLDRTALQQKIDQLEEIQKTIFRDFNEPNEKELLDRLDLMLRTVQAEYEKKQQSAVVSWVEKHKLQEKWWVWAGAAYLCLLIAVLPVWSLLFWLRPLVLYSLNEGLSAVSIKIPPFAQPVGLRHLLLLSPFHFSTRVLDAWVRTHQEQARQSFAVMKTVADRAVHVPVPVVLNNQTVVQPAPPDLCPVFHKTPFCLLIWGEGGSGKTSLACQLAGWVLDGGPAARHPMLPVLLEHDLPPEGGEHPVLTAIHKQVEERFTGGREVSPDLLRHLLRRQRLLVIVDHFSELRPETRERLRPGFDPQLTLNAVIVTSRQEENLRGSVTDTLKPLRIQGNRLSSFLEAYLTRLGKRELYDDPEFFAACINLTQMVGGRNLTVLLARMFADQMIAAKEAPGFGDLPGNIPDLMLSYLNWLNRQVPARNKEVQRLAKAVAWVSLEPTFRPTDANLAAVNTALDGEPDLEAKLAYLCRDLGIMQCVGPAEDKLRLTLDPVAEYLAGLRLLELYGGSELKWRAFLKAADAKEGAPQAIAGFLLALRDCCLAQGKDHGVPDFVARELAQKTAIPQEAEARAA